MLIGPGNEGRLESLGGLLIVEAGDAGIAALEAGEHGRQIAVAGRAGDDRDVGGFVEDALAFLLGDAADHGKLLAFALQAFVLVQPVEDLLLGFVADGAGVVKDEAGFVLHLGLHVALRLEGADHLLGVMGVHLAAEGLDIEALAHSSSISPGARAWPLLAFAEPPVVLCHGVSVALRNGCGPGDANLGERWIGGAAS